MNRGGAIRDLIRRVRRRSAMRASCSALPFVLWLVAGLLLLSLPVHFAFQPINRWSIAAAAMLMTGLWFARAFVISLPDEYRAALIADSWYDSKSLIATAHDLVSRDSREPFAALVIEQAQAQAQTMLSRPQQMPAPVIGHRSWLPAAIALACLMLLFVPGNESRSVQNEAWSKTAASTAATQKPVVDDSRSLENQFDRESPFARSPVINNSEKNSDSQAIQRLRKLPIEEAPPAGALVTATEAPRPLRDELSMNIAGGGDLPGATSADTLVVDDDVNLAATGEVGIGGRQDKSAFPNLATQRSDIDNFSVRYRPAQARYAADYFRELDWQGRNNGQRDQQRDE